MLSGSQILFIYFGQHKHITLTSFGMNWIRWPSMLIQETRSRQGTALFGNHRSLPNQQLYKRVYFLEVALHNLDLLKLLFVFLFLLLYLRDFCPTFHGFCKSISFAKYSAENILLLYTLKLITPISTFTGVCGIANISMETDDQTYHYSLCIGVMAIEEWIIRKAVTPTQMWSIGFYNVL